MRKGFDVSTWQDSPLIAGHIDFAKMRAWGADFVIIRAGQGNWVDPDFATSWANAKGILPRASYWYYDNRYPPKEQARKYYDIIRADPEGICWLDLEDKTAGAYAGWRNWYDFIIELQYPSPYSVGLYTGYYYFFDSMKFATMFEKEWFGQFPLWLAAYPADPFNVDHSTIKIPPPWTKYLILQSGTPAVGHAAGVESEDIDYNLFMGSDDEFVDAFGWVGAQQEPGATMAKNQITITWPDGCRERSRNSIYGTPSGILPSGSVHYSDFDVVDDADEPANPDKKWIQLQSGKFIATRYPSSTLPTRAVVTPILSTEPSGEYFLHVKDGVTRKFILSNE